MFSQFKRFLPFLAVSLLALSCTSLHQPQAPQDGSYEMRDCQPLPVSFLQRTFAPSASLPSQFKPYIDFWAKTEISSLTPNSFNKARGILHRLAADDSINDSQRKIIDTLALQLEHFAAMFDVVSAVAQPIKQTEDMVNVIQIAYALIEFRKRFPELATPSILQEELANNDCMLQEFAKQFDDCEPVRRPLVSWNLQSALSYKKTHETQADDLLPSNVAFLSTSVDIFKDQSETFIHFRALPKGTAILINGIRQTLPESAASGIFRLQLPPFDKADGRADITLLIPLPLPEEPLFAPWLSQRHQ